MAERVDLWVFAYDIVEDSIRVKVADELGEHGIRVQASVFELHLTKSASRRLWNRIRALCLPCDSLRLYRIPKSAHSDIRNHNGPPIPENADGFWLL